MTRFKKVEMVVCMSDRSWYSTIVELTPEEFNLERKEEIAKNKIKESLKTQRYSHILYVGTPYEDEK